MTDLESRIASLEKGAAFNATQDEIRKREEEFLTTLRDMKASILKDEQDGKNGGASSAEVDALREENVRLKAQVVKQAYRINHLVTGMEKMLESKKE
mmetsp:Transcript_13675/g.38504  ORF Transcript_13675/g.38504 Transcript_13675/m.38504 type:complete len:97 (-) Transcript_13675:1752-2042(-)